MTEHFSTYELLHSATAERYPRLRAQQMNPPASVLDNLEYLAETVLEPLRAIVGHPIRVTSGYRSPGVNKRVGGSATSQHLTGQAADIQLAPGSGVAVLSGRRFREGVNSNFFLFAAIVLNLKRLDVDQVIHEYGEAKGEPAWVHVSASKERDRRQILAIGSYTGRRYVSLTVEEALAFGAAA